MPELTGLQSLGRLLADQKRQREQKTFEAERLHSALLASWEKLSLNLDEALRLVNEKLAEYGPMRLQTGELEFFGPELYGMNTFLNPMGEAPPNLISRSVGVSVNAAGGIVVGAFDPLPLDNVTASSLADLIASAVVQCFDC